MNCKVNVLNLGFVHHLLQCAGLLSTDNIGCHVRRGDILVAKSAKNDDVRLTYMHGLSIKRWHPA